jgi:arsenate reductase
MIILLSDFGKKGGTMQVVIYHNPRCSKSRQTLQLLQDRGIEPEIIEYLKTPPGKTKLREILKLLGMKPRDLMRSKEAAYREAGLDQDDLSDEQLISAMIEHPVLIERPIVLANGKAALGRPPEQVLEIL